MSKTRLGPTGTIADTDEINGGSVPGGTVPPGRIRVVTVRVCVAVLTLPAGSATDEMTAVRPAVEHCSG